MSNTLLKIKRSAVKGKSPTTSNISLGELALNTNDGRVFFKTTDSSGTSAIATLREISGGTGITATNGVLNLDNQVTAQTVGNATTVPRLTINAQGQVTGVATATVAGVSGVDFDSSNGTLQVATSAGNFSDVITLDPYTTADLTENTNLYHTTARVNTAFDTRLGTKTTDNLSEGSTNLYHTTGRARGAISASGDLAYNSTTGVISFSQAAAPVLSVNGNTGSVSLQTNDITEHADNLYYTTARFDSDFGDNSTSDLSEGSNLYHTTARARGAISVSNSGTGHGAIGYTSGTGVLQYTKVTNANIRSAISASTGISITNGAISTTITQYTDAMADSSARTGISVTDAGGDGSLSYNNSTGVITYTGPSASEVRAHLSAGTGVSYSSGGQFSIGQAVGTTDDVTFNDVVVSGDLTVSGDQTTLSVGTLTVGDKNIVIADSATTSALTDGAGLTFGAWSSGTIPVLKWDHGNTRFDFNKPVKASSFVGNITGNVTGTVSSISNHDTDALSEGSSNLYHTTARARGAISASAGVNYSSSTGAITADQGEVRGFFSAGGDLSYNSSTGAFSFSETYSTPAELLTAIKTVDTNTSGLNADTLDGQEGTHYRINVYNSSGTLLN
jgi:hypothetical protein